MCDEYEKAKGVHSKDTCQKIYKEALESAVSFVIIDYLNQKFTAKGPLLWYDMTWERKHVK